MKIAIIVFPGSNRENDMAYALKKTFPCDISFVWHAQTCLPKVDLIILPGGFSYGDYLRCGAIAAKSPIINEIIAASERGVKLLGICNGFQILTEIGLLPGVLLRNASLRFICKEVYLRIENIASFTSNFVSKQVISLPIAHGDGNYFVDDLTLQSLENDGLVAMKYCNIDGSIGLSPNGSINNIAAIFNKNRNIMGMMPHPENKIDLYGNEGSLLLSGLLR